MHEGHRKRIMDRLKSGPDSLQDHEILEILLFNALPRVNTNPIAHDLIKSFGSLSGVFSASVEQLCSVRGIGSSAAEYIRCIGMCFERVRAYTEDLPRYFNVHTYSQYLENNLHDAPYEVLQIFCVDKNGKVFFRKTFGNESERAVVVDPTEISRILVAQAPRAVVVAHNHPHEVCRPSADDDDFTAQVQVLCSANNVKLYDHIIIGSDGAYSYYLAGRMDDIRRRYDVQNIIARNGTNETR